MTQDTSDSQFLIPEQNFPEFEKAIARLSKKCLKLTGEEISLVVFGYEMVEVKPKKVVKCFNVLLNTPQLVTGDWRFVGVIDHTLDENIGNLVRSLTSDPVPEQYRKGHVCDHCSVNRFRKQTFLLRETTSGEYRQVGSTCLKDFTQIDSVTATAKAAELLSDARSIAQSSTRYSKVDGQGVDLLTYMAAVVESTKITGRFVTVKEARNPHHSFIKNTAALAREITRQDDHIEMSSYEKANEILTWGRELVNDKKAMQSDYLYNLSVIARNHTIPWEATNMAASMYNAFSQSENPVISQYIGEVNQIVTVQFTAMTVEEKSAGNQSYWLIKGRDTKGNLISFTKPSPFIKQGETVLISGRISKLDNWKEKSTRLVGVSRG